VLTKNDETRPDENSLASRIARIEREEQSPVRRRLAVEEQIEDEFSAHGSNSALASFLESHPEYAPQARKAAAAVALGDRHHVQCEIGHGATATAFAIEDTRTQVTSCFKMFHPHIVDNEQLRDHLLKTSSALKSLNHRNIARVIHAGKLGTAYGVIQELIDGVSLEEILQGFPQVDLEDIVDWACDLGKAMEYAHSKGVIHRDLSPKNIKIANGAAIVLDLEGGVAGEECADTPRIHGAFPYVSPEQLSNGTVDRRTDIYNIGVIMYHLATGMPPFATPNQMLNETAPQAESDKRYIPVWFSRICAKCLEQDPGRRYQSARDLVRDLRRGDHIPVIPWLKTQMTALRSSLFILVTMLVAFVAGGGVIGTIVARSIADYQRVVVAMDLQDDWDATFSREVRHDMDATIAWLKSEAKDPVLRQQWLRILARTRPDPADLKLLKDKMPPDLQVCFFPGEEKDTLTYKEVQEIRFHLINVLNLFENIMDVEATGRLSPEMVERSFFEPLERRYNSLRPFVDMYRSVNNSPTAWEGIEKGIAFHKQAT
jgi:hypothetical protein